MKKIILTLFCATCLVGSAFSQWNIENMSEKKRYLGSAVMGDCIYIVGGLDGSYVSNKVEVYNTVTQTWMPTLFLSQPRCLAAVVASDSALYVAGGLNTWYPGYAQSNTVDIYQNGTWRTDTLPGNKYIAGAKALCVGNKVMFAGGYYLNTPTGSPVRSDFVFIYDETSCLWSMDTLSEKRAELAAATDGTIAIFAGGGGYSGTNFYFSSAVDIYNVNTNSWQTATLSQARSNLGGIYAGGKFYFAGGYISSNVASDVVDIFDGNQWTTANLDYPRGDIEAAVSADKVVFTGGGEMDLASGLYMVTYDLVDFYDMTQDVWSSCNMNHSKGMHTAIGVGNKIYVAGGLQKLGGNLNAIGVLEIWDITSGIFETPDQFNLKIHPNPASNRIYLSGLPNTASITHAEIFTAAGARVAAASDMQHGADISGLAPGLYCLRVHHDRGVSVVKFVKQ